MELTEEDIDTCQKAFQDFDEEGSGTIKVTDLKFALERIGYIPSENDLFKLISEVDDNNTGTIKFNDFLGIYAKHKASQCDDDDIDTIDAFVAMGG